MTDPIPLWLVHEEDAADWMTAQAPGWREWLQAQQFRGERHRVVLLAGAGGGIAAAVAGLGRRQGALNLWHGAGIADRLPPQAFALQQDFTSAEVTQLCLGFAYAAYRFQRYRREPAGSRATLVPPHGADTDYVALAAGALARARDWINTPAADFGPAELAATVREIAAQHDASYREWVGEELLRDNLPAIHAVGRASAAAPRLCELRWSPQPGTALPKLVLVGKGVCFDTGGLDLKPGAGMLLMKKDMGGAAVALALAHMLMSARVAVDLRLLIPAVENSVGGNAYRPGDVLATHKGLTVEVGNTDAEGRLVLCDALSLGDAADLDLIVDFATLTGAARVALGPELPALFGDDASLVESLARIAQAESDPLWPMPLWTPYEDELGSRIADLNNVAASSFAGAIVGALFLRRFVTAAPRWLHIDLYAWNPKERPGRSAGGEPQAVRALFRLLAERYGVANPAPQA
jgi:leucyl aminopeptidase